jgi:uncharacterized protein YjlB
MRSRAIKEMHVVRIRFSSSILSSLGLSRAGKTAAPSTSEPEELHLSRNGWVPNNERLPVLIYRNVIVPVPKRVVSTFEDRFRQNWWMPQSRNSIYDFHHYHSTAHEALGFARGHARLMLGGEGGQEVTLRAGDVLVLPVGTGHCKLEASPDFLVVGAYPQDMDWDICKTSPTAEMLDRMRHLKFPSFDPVTGKEGSLPRIWSRAAAVARAS